MGSVKRKSLIKIAQYFFLVLVTLVQLGPLYLLFQNSLKTQGDFIKDPIGFPTQVTLRNLLDAWVQGGYLTAFRNSLLVTAVSIVVVDICVGLCAYSLAKLSPRGGNVVINYFLLAITVPISLCLVPLFFLWQKLGLMNSLLGLTIIYCGTNIPFNVIFMRTFFVGIPNDIIESARLDGCSEVGIVGRIIGPISKPAFFTVSLLVGLSTWNEFYYANSFIQTDSLRTVATKYLVFSGTFNTNWSMVCAAGVITVLPMVLLYLVFQRNFIEGIVAGSVKG